MNHSLWSIVDDNDQAQCNLDPAAVSGSTPVDSSSVNSNGGKLIRVIPVLATEKGTFELKVQKPQKELPFKLAIKESKLTLRKGQQGEFVVEIIVTPKTLDGVEGRLTLSIFKDEKLIGGVTFLIKVATAYAKIFVHDNYSLPVKNTEVLLSHPGDPRILVAKTDQKGIAAFGPLNPGFYFASIKNEKNEKAEAVRIQIIQGKHNNFNIGKGGLLDRINFEKVL
jgi:hypothetical protein